MRIVPVASDDRLLAAFARYDAAWVARGDGLVAARVELSEALLACGEDLPPTVMAQLARDRAAPPPAVTVV